MALLDNPRTPYAPPTKTFPVMEVFGPTIQGEGPAAGQPCYFVRFGGCDYRCSWCDSMHAVDPASVRRNATRMTRDEITAALLALNGEARVVVLSGGNPALLELGPLVTHLRSIGKQVHLETQGSRWKRWMGDVDQLVISPKPPSSGMATEAKVDAMMDVVHQAVSEPVSKRMCLKVVVFDHDDYEWACWLHERFPYVPFFVSAGTPVGDSDEATIDTVLVRYQWICELAARDPRMARARVLPQLHVLAWGTRQGV